MTKPHDENEPIEPESNDPIVPDYFSQLGKEFHINETHIEEYFGVWAIHEQRFRDVVDRVGMVDLRFHIEDQLTKPARASNDNNQKYQMVSGGVAVIDIRGPMMKQASSLSGGTSTVRVRQAIRAAVADDAVASILLRIESPGGTVSGTKELAEDVAAAAKQKKVVAYIEDMGASAAYWVASQASQVIANSTAIVGSIGTFMVLQDASEAAAQKGIKVHVIRAGDMKGVGTPGTEITLEHKHKFQGMVDQLNDHFVRGVSKGRKMTLTATRELATGDVHIGEAAVKAGLIDAVQTLDQAIQSLQPQKKGKSMSATTEVSAATLAELKAACPGADNDFIVAQLTAEATEAVAAKAWMAKLSADMVAAKAEAATAKAEAAAAKTKPPKGSQEGVDPVSQVPGGKAAGEHDGDAKGAFEARLDELMAGKFKGKQKAAAIAYLHKNEPDLMANYIAEHNATYGEAARSRQQ